MKTVNTIRKRINQVLEYFACILLAIMVIFVTADVFCRYVLRFSFRWTEEISLILLIWFCFITLSIGVQEHLHLKIEMFIKKFPKPVKTALYILSELLILGVSVLLAIYGWKLVDSSMRSTLPATGLPTGVLYFMIPIVGVMMVGNTLFDLFNLRNANETEPPKEEGGSE